MPSRAARTYRRLSGKMVSCALIVLPLLGLPPNEPVYAQTTDRASIEICLYPLENELGYPVVLRLLGKNYENPRNLNLDLRRDQADSRTPEGAIEAVLAADRSADLQWIISTYEPEVGARLRSIYSDPARLTKSAEKSLDIRTVQLRTRIDFGSYVGFVRQIEMNGGREIMNLTPPLRVEKQAWVVCSDLGADPGWKFLQELVSSGRFCADRCQWADDEPVTLSQMLVRPIYPVGSKEIAPGAMLYYSGRKYAPAKKVDLDTGDREQEDSVEKVLRRLFVSLRAGDVSQALSLMHAEERNALASFLGKSIESAQSTARRTRECNVQEEVFYGQFIIVLLEFRTENNNVYYDWLILRREGNELFITDLLRNDPVVSQLGGRHYTFPKVVPLLWEE